MHMQAWANASPATDVYADPSEPPPVVYHDKECRHPGCTTLRGENDGQGYCQNHYRQVLRYGHPEGVRAKAREDLLEAAHGIGDHIDVEAEIALAEAAVRFAVTRRTPIASVGAANAAAAPVNVYATPEANAAAVSLARDGLVSVEFVHLRRCALAYTEHDAEAPLRSFESVTRALEVAAVKFYKFLVTP
jgi:hypothetical protein